MSDGVKPADAKHSSSASEERGVWLLAALHGQASECKHRTAYNMWVMSERRSDPQDEKVSWHQQQEAKHMRAGVK